MNCINYKNALIVVTAATIGLVSAAQFANFMQPTSGNDPIMSAMNGPPDQGDGMQQMGGMGGGEGTTGQGY